MSLIARKAFPAAVLIALLLLCLSVGRYANLFGSASTGSDPAPSMAARLETHLVTLNKSGILEPYDTANLKNVKYYAVYLSASWCPPCRIFTPKLVAFYKAFKPKHPDFELIFVNHDATSGDMLAYMKAESMPWPAVRYDDIDQTKLNDLDPNGGLPDLILTDARGKVLSDTFQGSDFLGPAKVLDDIKRLVQ
jgi:nucleoredoxin